MQRLNADPRMRQLNQRAFGIPAITETHLSRALAQFLRSMTSFRSRFDIGHGAVRNLEKPFPNFTAEENRGKAIFFGFHDRNTAQSCASCHVQSGSPPFGVDFRHALAPLIFQTLTPENNGLEARPRDQGAGKGTFRAPSLRNIAVTGPYMHDGSIRTLEEVVAFYAAGVQWSTGLDRRLVWGPPRFSHHWGGSFGTARPVPKLRTPGSTYAQIQPKGLGIPLDASQRRALVAFLKTLTDEDFLTDPRFSDPYSNAERKRLLRQAPAAASATARVAKVAKIAKVEATKPGLPSLYTI